jgi:STE24 endopeptidase
MESHFEAAANLWTWAFCALLLAHLATRFWLASRQIRHVATHRHAVPAAFESTIGLAAHQKAADYTIAKTRLGLLGAALSSAVLLAWTLLGGLHLLNQGLLALMGPGMGQQLALLGAFFLIGGLIELPLSWYATFRLEERFGFNRVTLRLWLADGAKGLVVAVVLGLPIAALVLWLMQAGGALWWLWAWAAWMAFNLLLLVIYPTFIAPLFNKFEPLQDESLKARIQSLMQRCGFSAKGLYVMDGSRRSAHANAYFTGFGPAKRVVFFDTLLSQLNADEVDAVLAHELGHFRHRHIIKRMATLFGLSLAGFALLGWLSSQVWFYTGLNVVPSLAHPNSALALLLFAAVVPLGSFFLTPLSSQVSRAHEFEADAYAMEQTSGRDLASALLKLYKDNASTLTPDPLFVKFYYSHPPASERLARMLQA